MQSNMWCDPLYRATMGPCLIAVSTTSYGWLAAFPLAPECVIDVFALALLRLKYCQGSFENDLVTSKPTLKEYVERLMAWRDRYEGVLALRPSIQPLDLISHWLAEFHHLTYDDVEIPGQYLEVGTQSASWIGGCQLTSTCSTRIMLNTLCGWRACRRHSRYAKAIFFTSAD
jgi:hypothetical protein